MPLDIYSWKGFQRAPHSPSLRIALAQWYFSLPAAFTLFVCSVATLLLLIRIDDPEFEGKLHDLRYVFLFTYLADIAWALVVLLALSNGKVKLAWGILISIVLPLAMVIAPSLLLLPWKP